MSWTVHNRDCIEHMLVMPDQSVDALVTDPPAGISFMGKAWDSDLGGRQEWVAWMSAVMRECLRVLKPGAHGLVWALPRTSHWTATALEDAGFEIRDVITHLFGQGFPKSLNVEKAGAKGWAGWGTALKPAAEFWILVRKPCSEKTVAANVQKWGTGALNIDASRVDGTKRNPGFINGWPGSKTFGQISKGDDGSCDSRGRFPANLILSHSPYCTDDQCDIECAVYRTDLQSGPTRTGHIPRTGNTVSAFGPNNHAGGPPNNAYGDKGGASRFFYCAKISAGERNAGLDGMEPKKAPKISVGSFKAIQTNGGVSTITNTERVSQNHHPTVKPTKLMGYLIRLITPPGGTVLDPFAGSGSTGIACKREGYKFIGIEKEKEYVEIARKRIEGANV